MKKINLLIVLILSTLIFTSCSSDDDNSSNNQGNIIGEWQLNKVTHSDGEVSLSNCQKQQTLTFLENGDIINYYVDNEPCNFSTQTFQYSIDEDELTFSIPGEGINGGTFIIKFNILELTNNKLVIQDFYDNEEGEYPESDRETLEYIKPQNGGTVDLSQLPDYNLEFTVDIAASGPNEPYEFQATFITTDGDNQLVETTETYSGLTANTDDFISDSKIVKEYKVVGVRATAVSDNVGGLLVKLTKVSDQNEVMNTRENIPNSATITYDFETGTETTTSN